MIKNRNKVTVKLRKKPITGERFSLYLDFYPAIISPKNGKRTRREFLNIYVPKTPRSVIEKREYKERMGEAEAIKVEREYQLLNGEYGKHENKDIDFVEYFEKYVKNYENGKVTTYKNMVAACNRFSCFCDGNLKMSEVNRSLVEAYRKHLEGAVSLKSGKPLSQNTKKLYFTKFRGVVLKAKQEGYLKDNPCNFVKGFKSSIARREYLTFEEVKQLFNTPIGDKYFAKICKFAIYTGIRFSDIKKLTWGEIAYSNSLKYHVKFFIKKTSDYEIFTIPTPIMEMLGERKANDELVFDKMKSYYQCRTLLFKWVKQSNINKKITFHCLRHTYAVLQLANGTDIFTLSKMMGHKKVETTQIYARVMDKAKVKAANAIPMI